MLLSSSDLGLLLLLPAAGGHGGHLAQLGVVEGELMGCVFLPTSNFLLSGCLSVVDVGDKLLLDSAGGEGVCIAWDGRLAASYGCVGGCDDGLAEGARGEPEPVGGGGADPGRLAHLGVVGGELMGCRYLSVSNFLISGCDDGLAGGARGEPEPVGGGGADPGRLAHLGVVGGELMGCKYFSVSNFLISGCLSIDDVGDKLLLGSVVGWGICITEDGCLAVT